MATLISQHLNLGNDEQDMPYFIVGDEAFALKTIKMKPFSKRNMSREERIFDYRLSRSRRIVENAFGILANRFQCLLTRASNSANHRLCLLHSLHNLMRLRYPAGVVYVWEVCRLLSSSTQPCLSWKPYLMFVHEIMRWN